MATARPIKETDVGKSTADVSKTVTGANTKDDKNADALMTTHLHLEKYLAPAPNAIALLGNLILISTRKDFSLQRTDPKEAIEFKHVHIPSSFRASLIQISNTGWTAFNKAHQNMDQIGLHANNIESQVRHVVYSLFKGSDYEIQAVVPDHLESIQETACECQDLAKDIENGFDNVLSLINEVLEACTSSKGVYETKFEDDTKELKAMEFEKEASETRLKKLEELEEKAEKEMKKAQDFFEKEMDNLPSTSKIVCLAVCGAFIDAMRFWSGAKFGSRTETSTRETTESIGATGSVGSDASIFGYIYGIDELIDVIVRLLTENQDDNGAPSLDKKKVKENVTHVKHNLTNVQTELKTKSLCNEQQQMLSICKEAIAICSFLDKMVSQVNVTDLEKQITETIEKVKSLQTESKQIRATADKLSGNTTLNDKPPHQVKITTSSTNPSLIKHEVEAARYKTETAKAKLTEAKQEQDKIAEETRKEIEKYTQVMKKTKHLDLAKIGFDEIRQVLKDGLEVLGNVKKQWAALVVFFGKMANQIKICLKYSADSFAKNAGKYKSSVIAGKVANTLRDIMLQNASDASKTAYVTQSIATTYVDISKNYIITQLACLGRLVAYDPNYDQEQIDDEREKLAEDCEKATKEIQLIMKDRKEYLKKQIDDRITYICEIESKLQKIAQPKDQKIKETVERGFSDMDVVNF